jgi:hypothetical protein
VSERLAWLVLRAVNRAQAKGSTVRLVAPRDPEIVGELSREVGLGPTDEELSSAEDYLLEHGYIAPRVSVPRGAFVPSRLQGWTGSMEA